MLLSVTSTLYSAIDISRLEIYIFEVFTIIINQCRYEQENLISHIHDNDWAPIPVREHDTVYCQIFVLTLRSLLRFRDYVWSGIE